MEYFIFKQNQPIINQNKGNMTVYKNYWVLHSTFYLHILLSVEVQQINILE